MLRCTEVVSKYFEIDDEGYHEWIEFQNVKRREDGRKELDPKQILRWASQFGTSMHRWCLEGNAPKVPSKIQQKCYDNWLKFLEDEEITIIKAEKEVSNGKLYRGTLDAHAEQYGCNILLDLKFWKCWRWAPVIDGDPLTSYENSAINLAKTNMQTDLYMEADSEVEYDSRAVVSINPLGAFYKTFSRRSKKAALAIEELTKEKLKTNF